jgi:hypothetical protein
MQHVVDRDRQRAVVAEQHRADAVAHQNDLGAGLIGEDRHRMIVRGEQRDDLALALHVDDHRRGHLGARVLARADRGLAAHVARPRSSGV